MKVGGGVQIDVSVLKSWEHVRIDNQVQSCHTPICGSQWDLTRIPTDGVFHVGMRSKINIMHGDLGPDSSNEVGLASHVVRRCLHCPCP